MPQPGRGRERQVQWRGGGVASNIIGRNCAVGGKDGRANRANKFVPSFIAVFCGDFHIHRDDHTLLDHNSFSRWDTKLPVITERLPLALIMPRPCN